MNWSKETEEYISTIKKQMENIGVLEEADIANLNLLGDAHNLYIRAMKELNEQGLTTTDTRNRAVVNPAFNIVRSQQAVMVSLFKELSISARQRRLLVKDNIVVEEDPMDTFFQKMEEN